VNTVTTFIAAFICITSPWVLVLWAWNETRNQQNRLQMLEEKYDEKDENAYTEQIV